MEFLVTEEKLQLQQILTKSSYLQTADDRRNFLTFCGLENSCELLQLDQSLSKFVISLCSTLSKVHIKSESSERLGLVIFLEYINRIDSSLSSSEQGFIQHVITQWERWQTFKSKKQQSEYFSYLSASKKGSNKPSLATNKIRERRDFYTERLAQLEDKCAALEDNLTSASNELDRLRLNRELEGILAEIEEVEGQIREFDAKDIDQGVRDRNLEKTLQKIDFIQAKRTASLVKDKLRENGGSVLFLLQKIKKQMGHYCV
ncbi:hypothetical protein [Trichocoleus sp. FACHB-262]|uniref:hypothetical protein n=1 Tax=Trichocoleus sp. FACHB-262 TaxID=2692869 RepID=UPI00168310A1|nr:hypothetical protein [Trichocoleus sp. FACHB-262]MBD2120293.1 hypothetical protein [Trichocoleus sp. FACHB-262]